MRYLPLACFLFSIVLGYVAIYVQRGSSTLNEVYVDNHGDTWRVPTNGWITQLTNKVINTIPRFNMNFGTITPLFDLDNNEYIQSSIIYIIICGAIGCVFFVAVLIFFICRYLCGCCGGKALPRRGYRQGVINSVRISLIIFSFIFEGILMYGYFANTDLHSSLNKLVNYFVDIGDKIQADMDLVTEILDKNKERYGLNDLYQENKDAFHTDLKFSERYAVSQTKVMKDFIGKVESLRMGLILMNLILSTIGCAVGIAAGSVMRGFVMIIMVIMNTVSAVFFFFSTGCHFAASKIIYEYCEEIDYYITDIHWNERIPMRLQYFIPCVNSPLFPYINDFFATNSVSAISDLVNSYADTSIVQGNSSLSYSPPFWFNVTDSFYLEKFNELEDGAKKTEVLGFYGKAVNESKYLQVLDRQRQCTFSKDQMRNEQFLMCSYTKDNLDMLTVTQAVGCILVVIITLIGLPAIKKFEWAGNANLGGVLNGKKKFIGKKPKAKRQV